MDMEKNKLIIQLVIGFYLLYSLNLFILDTYHRTIYQSHFEKTDPLNVILITIFQGWVIVKYILKKWITKKQKDARLEDIEMMKGAKKVQLYNKLETSLIKI